jgi:hypothetical protein
MLTATLKSLLARKLRLLLSALAVVLGVMAVSGALVLTDNLGRSFDALFQTVNQNLDVQVSGAQNVQDAERGGDPVTTPIPAEVVGEVAAVPGVQSAIGVVIADGARVVDPDGKVIGSAGPPRFGVGWRGEVGFTQLREGRGPQAPEEVAISAGLAKQGNFQVGDRIGVLTLQPKKTFTLVGIFGYTGGRDSLGGETRVAFTEPVAQQLLLGKPGTHSVINVQAQQGISPSQSRPADRGAGKRLLDDLLGLVQVAGDQQQLTEQPPDRAGVELLEAFGGCHRPSSGWRTPPCIYMPCCETRATRCCPMTRAANPAASPTTPPPTWTSTSTATTRPPATPPGRRSCWPSGSAARR